MGLLVRLFFLYLIFHVDVCICVYMDALFNGTFTGRNFSDFIAVVNGIFYFIIFLNYLWGR